LKWKLIIKDKSKQPLSGSYPDWKEQIASECYNQCIYCAINESQFGGIDHYHIEHYRPKSKPAFKGLINDITNLFYACPICNRFKSDDWPSDTIALDVICYPDPSVYDYSQLFTVDPTDYKLVGNYISSTYIIHRLFLNRPQLLYERREEILNMREISITHEIEMLRKNENIKNDPAVLNQILDALSDLKSTLEKRSHVRPYKLAEIRK
jgi:hypothetical protein